MKERVTNIEASDSQNGEAPLWKKALYKQALDNLDIPVLVSGNTRGAIPVTHGPMAEVVQTPIETTREVESTAADQLRYQHHLGNLAIKYVLPAPAKVPRYVPFEATVPTSEMPRIETPAPALAWSQSPLPEWHPLPEQSAASPIKNKSHFHRAQQGKHRKQRRHLIHFN